MSESMYARAVEAAAKALCESVPGTREWEFAELREGGS